MRSRTGAVLLVLVALLFVAACSGGGGGGKVAAASGDGSVPAGADYAPASSVAFVSVDSDTDSSQWKAASDLLDKFPAKDRLIGQIESALANEHVSFEQDVKPAVGSETDVAILKLQGETGNAIALTQPKDESKFEDLFRKVSKKGAFFARIGDWTAASDTQAAVDRAKAAHDGTSLADQGVFSDAMQDLPSDSLVRVWVNGPALGRGLQELLKNYGQSGAATGNLNVSSLAAALQAHPDGAALRIVARTTRSLPAVQYSSKLVEQVPAGALAYLSFKGVASALNQLRSLPPSVKTQIEQFESQLGVTVPELARLLKGEGALYVRQGIPLPEITLVLEQSDTSTAQSIADRLFTHLAPQLHAQIASTSVAGVPVKQLKAEQFSIYYGIVDGKLVVTDATTGISGLRDSGQKLADDARFKAAKAAAGMPDATAGFLYVNLRETIPLIVNGISSFGGKVDPEVQENLDPLDSLLFYATLDGTKATVSGFVGVK